jgi:histidinol-phosphate aminotransferase
MLLELLVRKNIWNLKPYSSARNEYNGKNAEVFLDANENPYNEPLNRYPDPLQNELKSSVSFAKNVPVDNIFLGNGSDEPIDLVFRIFCRPQIDNVVAIAPTYGMYEVCANINDVEYRKVRLGDNFKMNAQDLLQATDANTKLIFICSPNNPTGNAFPREEILKVINNFEGIVVIDEAYSDFCNLRPFRLDILKYPNIIVLNTFSKAYGCAAIRLGMAFASEQIIQLFNKVKYPYNVNLLTQNMAKQVLKDKDSIHQRIVLILKEREMLMSAVDKLPITKKLYSTDANFFLVKVTDANAIYNYLVNKGIIVRNRNQVELCDNCLRITVGTKQENSQLLSALRTYK